MDAFKLECPEAYAWLEEKPPNEWCRAFFSDFVKCDVLTNNSCEVFNKWILEARELPVLSMLENIACQIGNRYYKKQREAIEQCTGQVCPKIRQKIEKNTEYAANCRPRAYGRATFDVKSNNISYIVELNLLACSCHRWQLTGVPCSHSIACLRSERIKPEQMVNSCYSIHSYMQAYGANIMPLTDHSEWQHVNGPTILPPSYEKKVGRPPKSRRKAPEEKAGGTRLNKHGVTIHCGYCRAPNHNRGGCPRLKAIAEAEARAQRHAQEQAHVNV